ncbi:hypothetical protein Y032_0954g3197 [Ancylostoma ceylanicum]|uniref:Uncharacterized protein n=1 Tax=Ancylostoma ceylanicum TaxID=53326 RepID=A0A016W8K5_9BILA|nr:hypothetical protein Y032_0954g3197 [Ancylostoma ceylanicum]
MVGRNCSKFEGTGPIALNPAFRAALSRIIHRFNVDRVKISGVSAFGWHRQEVTTSLPIDYQGLRVRCFIHSAIRASDLFRSAGVFNFPQTSPPVVAIATTAGGHHMDEVN